MTAKTHIRSAALVEAEKLLYQELTRFKAKRQFADFVGKVEHLIDKYKEDAAVLAQLTSVLDQLFEESEKKIAIRHYSTKFKMESWSSANLNRFAELMLWGGATVALLSLGLGVALSSGALALSSVNLVQLLSGFLGGFLSSLLSYPVFELADCVNAAEYIEFNSLVRSVFFDPNSELYKRTQIKQVGFAESKESHQAPLKKLLRSHSQNMTIDPSPSAVAAAPGSARDTALDKPMAHSGRSGRFTPS